jgi:UDP-N-acetylmuramoyl-tripeptide--D-alanyl-D-alanine ligase
MLDLSIFADEDGVFFNRKAEHSEFSVCTDSRIFQPGQMFFAIRSDSRDGFDFHSDVLKQGTPFLVCENITGRFECVSSLSKAYPQTTFLIVDNVIKYMGKIAQRRIHQFQAGGGIVVGITGSNGKTTTKDMLFHLCSSVSKDIVWATKGNFNNHIGVPLTIFQLNHQHKIAIIEMGMNHPGEIAELCSISSPQMGTITSIGEAHIEFLGSKENIFHEKKALYDYILTSNHKDKFFVSDGDCQFLSQLDSEFVRTLKENKDYIFNDTQVELIINDQKYDISSQNFHGKHNYSNLIKAFTIAIKLFPNDLAKLICACKTFMPGKNRSQLIKRNDQYFYLDAYNANPSSMEASIAAFISMIRLKKHLPDEVMIILGDMNELGEHAPECHQRIGRLLQTLPYKSCFFVGRYSKHYQEGFGPNAKTFESLQAFIASWHMLQTNYKYFFIKGSRSLQLESIMDIK